MKKTPWYRPDQVPARAGWYERDHRKVREYINSADRRISLDLWEPVPDKADALWPGVWYVKHGDEIDDASWQRLPWRGIAK